MKDNKALKIIIRIVLIVVIVALIAFIAGYSYLQFVILPKLNSGSEVDSDKISVSDITKELGDKQVIDNIINFDKTSASEMLHAITEIDNENESEKADSGKDSKTETKEPEKEPEPTVSREGTTAYQRIASVASKEEISQGMAIISKVSMSKVNELRKSGDTDALKAYIKSVLSPGEISTALKLYNKYKHLL